VLLWGVAFRIDTRGTVRKFESTPQDGMRVDAALTRGDAVFEYRQPDGSVIREFRPLSEVSHADSLATLRSAPVTLGHPPGKVTRKNYRSFAVGQLDGGARMDADHVVGELVIQADDALAAIETGNAREVSCGYTCKIDPTPGVTASGERYDCVQTGIVYNHIAIVAQGRAGSSVRLRLDSNGDIIPDTYETPSSGDSEPSKEEPGMTPEQIAKLQLENETLRGDLAAATARADKAEGENAVNKARADAAEKAVQERADADELASVVAVATKLVKGFKADGKTAAQVKAEVVASKFPTLKLDAAQLDGAFAAASAERADDSAAVRAAARPVVTETKADAKPVSNANSNWRFAKAK